MKFDRKLLLIAPTIVLAFIVAGIVYAAVELKVLGDVGDTWKERSDFIGSLERGERTVNQKQAVELLRFSLEVEEHRTSAIAAAYEVLFVLAVMTAACCVVLAVAIRRIPREHWPRFGSGRKE